MRHGTHGDINRIDDMFDERDEKSPFAFQGLRVTVQLLRHWTEKENVLFARVCTITVRSTVSLPRSKLHHDHRQVWTTVPVPVPVPVLPGAGAGHGTCAVSLLS